MLVTASVANSTAWLHVDADSHAFIRFVFIDPFRSFQAIVVFWKRIKIQRNFHSLMLCLATFDLVYISVSIIIFSLPHFSDSYLTSGAYFYIMPWALPIAQIGSTGSIYFTMAMTIERYLTVCHPFYHHSHAWPTRCYVLPILLFSIFYNMPRFFELETKYHDPNDNNSTLATSLHNTSTGEADQSNDSQDVNTTTLQVNYYLSPTEVRTNYYYYTIYLVTTWNWFFSLVFYYLRSLTTS